MTKMAKFKSKMESKKNINPLFVLLVVGVVVSLAAVVLLQGSDNMSGKFSFGSSTSTKAKVPMSLNLNRLLSIKQLPVSPSEVKAGGYHSCMLTTAGSLYCWGDDMYGQLGLGSMSTGYPQFLPTKARISSVKSMALGTSHTCAINSSGTYCWGNNFPDGQLGDGTVDTKYLPSKVSFNAVQLAAGYAHTCGLNSAGEVYCWGRNTEGQLGDGTTVNSKTPKKVSASMGTVKTIASGPGASHTCALNSAGQVYCWGFFLGLTNQGKTPTLIQSTQMGTVTSIAVGEAVTCAINSNKDVYCWGYNDYGKLGTGNNQDAPGTGAAAYVTPVKSKMTGATKIFAGNNNVCAVNTVGATYCWGKNDYKQVSSGAVYIATPTQIPLDGSMQLANGGLSTCAINTNKEVYCWGSSSAVGLGDAFVASPIPPPETPRKLTF